MDYRIEKIDYDIRIVGKLFEIDTERAKEQISSEYSSSHTNGLLDQLIKMAWVNPKRQLESIIGVIGEGSSIEESKFNFIMGVRYEDTIEGMTEIVIPPCTWAVFPNIETAWKRLYTEWLPSSTYELEDLPCLEHSLPPDRVPNNELWVPVKEK